MFLNIDDRFGQNQFLTIKPSLHYLLIAFEFLHDKKSTIKIIFFLIFLKRIPSCGYLFFEKSPKGGKKKIFCGFNPKNTKKGKEKAAVLC